MRRLAGLAVSDILYDRCKQAESSAIASLAEFSAAQDAIKLAPRPSLHEVEIMQLAASRAMRAAADLQHYARALRALSEHWLAKEEGGKVP